jgi:DNA-binding SARP family transcriptional activator
MTTLCVRLFRKLAAERDGELLSDFESKAQELLSFLLLYRQRPHLREALASVLWPESDPAQSKKYLRQALWQLQSAVDPPAGPQSGHLLLVESDWIRIDPAADVWVDVAHVEEAFTRTQGVPGHQLGGLHVQALRTAVSLYQGDLLEGWLQDWCLFERERLQNIYLTLLDKLMAYCEAQHQYDEGIGYGASILRLDRARERTHRRLMRLYARAGDRTAALRQYERCVATLAEELDVPPSQRTTILLERIRADRLDAASPEPSEVVDEPVSPGEPVHDALGRLRQLHGVLAEFQDQLQQDIRAVELSLHDC